MLDIVVCMILETFPTTEEFYRTYWNQKPFLVRGAIEPAIIDGLIDADSLAGLSLEEDIKSRIVVTAPEGGSWDCSHGPFESERFSEMGERNWSLLVQNVEQYHLETADLLKHFQFSPRWLMDDIMVSYSTAGGSVGPHTDSYHVFLVQGMGAREWKISHSPIKDGEHIAGIDLQVLKDGFAGDVVEVRTGDVLYIPPHFAHEGVTLEEAMTFSVGFLGPKLSELMVEYGQYLEMQEDAVNVRYSGDGLDAQSAGFSMGEQALGAIQSNLVGAIESPDFSAWMAEYFSTPTYDDVENIEAREVPLSGAELLAALNNGQILQRPEHIKIAITPTADGGVNLAAYGVVFCIPAKHVQLADALNDCQALSIEDAEEAIEIITALYNHTVLDLL